MDVLACVMVAIATAHETGRVDLGDTEEGSLRGHMNSSARSLHWKGRTLDLSKAYKQVPISFQSQQLSVLGYSYKGEWLYFTTNRFPFGATAAVYIFNRISRSIHFILCKFLQVVCTCFYYDFPALSHDAGAGLVSKSMSLVLNLLGGDHAQLGVKAFDFAPEFAALGITIKPTNLHRGSFVLANKEGRIPKIVAMLEKVKSQGTISRNEAAEIQGHLNFASGFFLSKSLKFLLGQFDAVSRIPGTVGATKLSSLCEVTKALLFMLPPREFNSRALAKPFLLFTDGAWEDQCATAGMLLYNPLTGETVVREIVVPATLINLWQTQVGEQIICQIEFFAFLAARFEYRAQLENSSTIAWIDNEAARFAASKGSATSISLMAMARLVQTLEAGSPGMVWVERVCSFSNPADKPSRKQCTETAQLFNAMHHEPIELPGNVILAIESLTTDPYQVISLQGLFE